MYVNSDYIDGIIAQTEALKGCIIDIHEDKRLKELLSNQLKELYSLKNELCENKLSNEDIKKFLENKKEDITKAFKERGFVDVKKIARQSFSHIKQKLINAVVTFDNSSRNDDSTNIGDMKTLIGKCIEMAGKALKYTGKMLESLSKAISAIPYVGKVIGTTIKAVGKGLSATGKAMENIGKAISSNNIRPIKPSIRSMGVNEPKQSLGKTIKKAREKLKTHIHVKEKTRTNNRSRTVS